MDKYEKKLVLALIPYDKIRWLGSLGVLRLEQWRDGSTAWRAGMNWFSEDEFDFICEKPTLEECLDCIIKRWSPPKKKIKWEKKKTNQ